MKGWPKQPPRDWSLRPKVYPCGPSFSKEEIDRIKAMKGPVRPDESAVITKGLCHSDFVVVSWMGDKQIRLNGVRVAVYRDKTLLRWSPAGWLRDASGKYLYAPYLTSLSLVDSFVEMLATACGCSAVLEKENLTHRQYGFKIVDGDNHRLILGDCLSFDWQTRTLQVQRPQGTLDMNLYRPEDGVIMKCGVGYICLYHHTTVLARLLTEINGRQAQSLGNDQFLVVP